MDCKRPPSGWYCTREEGHEGPCAALPTPENQCTSRRGELRCYKEVGHFAHHGALGAMREFVTWVDFQEN